MSTLPTRPNIQLETEARLLQSPRTVRHVQPYWLQMLVPFTSVANEQITALTETEGFTVLIRGSWTDLLLCRVRYMKTGSRRDMSADAIPILAQAGSPIKVNPMLYWGNPLLLSAKETLRGDFVNTGTEAAGQVDFYSEVVDGKDRRIEVKKSQTYYLLTDLSSASLIARTPQSDTDLLIWGAITNTTTVTGRIIDESTNDAWSPALLPLRTFAGASLQVQPIMRYPHPYLLPAYVQLRVEYSAAAAGNYLVFLCERLIA